MNRIKELKQVNWRELKPLQPKDAKIVTNHNAIENSLKRYGFAKPFYGWEFEGEVYTLDGHQRKEVLSNMQNVPETLPCVLIDAKDRKEAIEMLIEVHNQTQNPFDIEVLEEMIEVEELSVEIQTVNVKIETEEIDYSKGVEFNDMTDEDVDIEEEFNPIGTMDGKQRVVFLFDGAEEAESYLNHLKVDYKKMNMAWQVDLSTPSI